MNRLRILFLLLTTLLLYACPGPYRGRPYGTGPYYGPGSYYPYLYPFPEPSYPPGRD